MSQGVVSQRVSEIIGVASFAAALIWLISLASYSPHDPVWFFRAAGPMPPVNFAGRVGAFVGEASYQLVGLGAYLVPTMLAVVGWHYFWCRALAAPYTKVVGGVALLLCVSTLSALALDTVELGGERLAAGGYAGSLVARVLTDYLNRTGSVILVVTILFLSLITATQLSFGQLALDATHAVGRLSQRLWIAVRRWREARARDRERQDVVKKHLERGADPSVVAEAERRSSTVRSGQAERARKASAPMPAESEAKTKTAEPRVTKSPKLITPTLPLSDPMPVSKAPAERRPGEYALPPHTLLDQPRTEQKIDERELMEAARHLEAKCREFSVEGTVVQIHPGPVVTTFEFRPDAGVKYSKITSLTDDLCLAMQAESILIDRIPGKSTVGIQIPNANREHISLRELLESDTYRRSASKLTLALGKSIHGEPYVADLATMPHLLIAGSTGTGKSVGLNAMLTSILYRATPEDVRLIMIDPKRLELGMYEDIPHLLTPVVVEPKLAANALRWAVKEMEERYKTLAAAGVRNIEQYNRNIRAELEERGTEVDADDPPPRPLPFIVVVIDELADLMMVASNDVEESIARLAQMARAVGIHLILATQRPSVDVITGTIKTNLPARISFRVSSRIDSRTILDAGGAEQLLGRGDMLFIPPASSRMVRLHGPYISEQETARLASFLRKQARPVYDPTITEETKTGEGVEFEKDDLYDEAARIVVSSGQASISYLQRRLRIGFSRAARLVDMMEAEGIVSSATGGRPREVLVAKDYFEAVDVQLR
ncbi:MAG: DNA translocase FtsK [Vicinamibacterales bacterium]